LKLVYVWLIYFKIRCVDDNSELILEGTRLSVPGKYEEAIQCFDKALAINPDDKDGWNGKGDALDN